MIDKIFNDIKEELIEGIKQKTHPFKFCTLATTGINQTARIRTVVLRDVDDKLNLTFYTDKRTKKVTHIRENKNVSMLFYHPEKQIQLRIEGYAHLEEKDKIVNKIWDALHESAKKDYTTTEIPGTEIKSPDLVTYINDHHFFSIIRVLPHKIDYIQLDPANHIRAYYTLEDEKWEGTYLVP